MPGVSTDLIHVDQAALLPKQRIRLGLILIDSTTGVLKVVSKRIERLAHGVRLAESCVDLRLGLPYRLSEGVDLGLERGGGVLERHGRLFY